jgi:hypothetical protein
MGHSRRFCSAPEESVSPSRTDIVSLTGRVRKVPIPEIRASCDVLACSQFGEHASVTYPDERQFSAVYGRRKKRLPCG